MTLLEIVAIIFLTAWIIIIDKLERLFPRDHTPKWNKERVINQTRQFPMWIIWCATIKEESISVSEICIDITEGTIGG